MGDYDGLEPSFQQQLMNFIAASDGRIWLNSGYRSEEEQAALWEEAVAKYGEEEARWWVAPPGSSYHNKGLAADLGGDMEWAGAHAAEFGLYRPLDNEDWHFEPIGTRDGESDGMPSRTGAFAIEPKSTTQYKELQGKTPLGGQDAMQTLLSMLRPGMTSTGTTLDRMMGAQAPTPITPLGTITINAGTPPAPSLAPLATVSIDDIDKFMAVIRQRESSNRYHEVNPESGAGGAYQFMPGTWAYYKGYALAQDAPPHIQDEKARELMLSYYNEYGNWGDVAAAWYSGPGGNWASGEVQEYVQDIVYRMAE